MKNYLIPPRLAPTSSLSANPSSGNAPLEVTFLMSASDSDGYITTWVLNAGDGQSYSGNGNPPLTQKHTYTSQGNYTAVLAVSDNDDATDFSTQTITVSPPMPDLIVSDIMVAPDPPKAAGYTTITIAIKNQGGSNVVETFLLELYFDGVYQGHVYINGLAAGSSYTSSWQAMMWPADTNYHIIKGVVDPTGVVNESNEGNNELAKQFRATEPPQGTGTLKIESVPGNADVYVDGVYKGQTPLSGYLTIPDLTAGDHSLKVTKSGYKDWIGTVTIPSGSIKYEAVILEVEANRPPDPPGNLAQLKSDGQTEIPIGGTIDETTIFVKAKVSDPDGDKVTLQVEARRVGDNFVPRFTHQSSLVSSNEAKVAIYGLVNGEYHWQARAVDERGLISDWVDFGNNDNLATDFKIFVNRLPFASFTYLPNTPNIGEDIVFDASSSYDPDGGQLFYNWDFGDGATAEGKETTHKYLGTGEYTATLTITDEKGAESKCSLLISVFSRQLEENIEAIVNSTNNLLDGISQDAAELAEALDYFNQKVSSGERKIFVSGAMSIICTGIKGVIDLGVIGEIIIDVEAEGLEEAMNFILGKLEEAAPSTEWFCSEVLEEKIKTQKENLAILKEEVVNNIGTLTQQEIDLYIKNLRSLKSGNVFIKDFYESKSRLPVTFAALEKDDERSWTYIAGTHLWSVSLGIGGIAGSLATGGVLAPYLISGGVSVLEAARSQAAIVSGLSKDGEMAVLALTGLVDGPIQATRVYENTRRGLETIKQRGQPIIAEGKIISINNIVQGRKDVFGYSVDWFTKNAFSEVRIQNNGQYATNYILNSKYQKTFTTVDLLPYIPTGGIGERRYDIQVIDTEQEVIEPIEEKTIVIKYLENKEGCVPKGDIWFNLSGKTPDGVYGLQMNSTKIETIFITEEGEIVPEEQTKELQVRTYPIRSENRWPFAHDTQNLIIYISNPFDFQIQANLTQEIPSGLEIIQVRDKSVLGDLDTDGDVDMTDFAVFASAWATKIGDTLWYPACDISDPADNVVDVIDLAVLVGHWLEGTKIPFENGNLVWTFELGPEERKEITITFISTQNLGTTIEIPGAKLKINDQVHDHWLEFISNSTFFKGTSISDFNGDGVVNFLDLAELGNKWLQTCFEPSWCEETDINHSRFVDFGDFAILANYWLESVP